MLCERIKFIPAVVDVKRWVNDNIKTKIIIKNKYVLIIHAGSLCRGKSVTYKQYCYISISYSLHWGGTTEGHGEQGLDGGVLLERPVPPAHVDDVYFLLGNGATSVLRRQLEPFCTDTTRIKETVAPSWTLPKCDMLWESITRRRAVFHF